MVPIFLLMNRMASRRKLLSTTAKPRAYKKDPGRRGEFCRTCLSTKNLECIFADMECEENRSEELRLVTGLDIKLNDGLSQKICIRCNRTINATLRLRRVSRKTERILIKMTVKNKKVKPRRKIPRATKIEKELNSSDVNIDVEGSIFDYEDYDYDLEFPEHFESKLQEDMQREESEVEIERPVRRRRSETPATSYKCNICGKEFRMKATYKAHERFHTNYCVCEVCGKRCRNNNQLQEHKRARHGLGRIHKCAYCEYSSATKEALVIHERRHTGERPYVCDHCGASFYRRSTLVQHIAIHLPEKNFQCDMCPKRLKSKKFLQIHKHNAHTGKRYGYLCSVCDHRFEKPNKVRAHTRRVHGLPDDQQGPIVRVIL